MQGVTVHLISESDAEWATNGLFASDDGVLWASCGQLWPSLASNSGTFRSRVNGYCKGWLAKIHRTKNVHQQIPAYERLINLFHFFEEWEIVSFPTAAADAFKELRKQKVRIGSQNLKIAAIAVTFPALLLSANLRDFRQVPGLQVDNWLKA